MSRKEVVMEKRNSTWSPKKVGLVNKYLTQLIEIDDLRVKCHHAMDSLNDKDVSIFAVIRLALEISLSILNGHRQQVSNEFACEYEKLERREHEN